MIWDVKVHIDGIKYQKSRGGTFARELAKRTGENITEAVRKALQERLQHIRNWRRPVGLADQLDEIAKRCAALPIVDFRREDEILGYGKEGLPSCRR